MSTGTTVKVRRLPDNGCTEAIQTDLAGRLMGIQFAGTAADYGPGDLVEVESPGFLWLGEVIQRSDSVVTVAVEHHIDCARLPSLEGAWK